MSKSILVIDTPIRCEDCPCYTDEMVSKHWNICRKLNKKVDTETNKPYWCPLKPMPQKRDKLEDCGMFNGKGIEGWNACIETILGEQE